MKQIKAFLSRIFSTQDAVRGAHIEASGIHDAGAYARCSYCGRYSDNVASLNKWTFLLVCDCGRAHGWCGSFKKPNKYSEWSESTERSQI